MSSSLQDGDPLAFELLCGLPEAPRVVDHLADAVLLREVTDELDALQDTAVTVVDAGADVQAGVAPDDGRGRAFAADVDTDPTSTR